MRNSSSVSSECSLEQETKGCWIVSLSCGREMLLPQNEKVLEVGSVKMDNKGNNANVIEAIAEGATTGMQMVISIGASLVAMVGLVFAINKFIGMFGISLEQILCYVFAPFGFFWGLDGPDILMEGALLGNKLVLNEFIAFQDVSLLSAMIVGLVTLF